jgi:Protein of unknown function (DUF2795)
MILYNKVKSTFMVDGEVYKRIRILAIEKNMEVSAVIEEAMREKLDREYPQYHQQSQPPQPKMVGREIREEIPPDYSQVEKFDLDLHGLKFPATKNKIIEFAKKGSNTRSVINAINRIPDRTYNDENVDLRGHFVTALKEVFSSERVKSSQVKPQQ